MTNVSNIVFGMITENTGRALCDSGDAYGRNFERNAKMTLQDFKNRPAVSIETKIGEPIEYTIDLFNFLTSRLEIDELCDEFNSIPNTNLESDIYGVSKEGREWLDVHGFEVGDSWNSYNWENSLSQVIQGTSVKLDSNDYVLLQVHGGCDVRGGYTDAKLFKLSDEHALAYTDVYGSVVKKDGSLLQISSAYDGVNITDETDEVYLYEEGDEVDLELGEV